MTAVKNLLGAVSTGLSGTMNYSVSRCDSVNEELAHLAHVKSLTKTLSNVAHDMHLTFTDWKFTKL